MSIWKVFRIYYRYLLENRRGLFAITLLTIIMSSVFNSLSPYFYKLFIDNFSELNFKLLLGILLIYFAVRVSGLLIGVFSHFVGDKVLFNGAINARVSIFKHVQDLDFAFHTQKSTGSLISAFKRGDGAFFTLFHVVHFSTLRTFTAFAVMTYFFSGVSFTFVILSSLSVILMLLSTKFVIAKNIRERKKFNTAEDEVSSIITDNFINFDTVKLFAKESWEIDRLKNKFKDWYDAIWGYGSTFRNIDLGVGAVDNISIFIIFLLSLYMASQGKLTVGNFVLVSGFITSFYSNVWDLVWSFRDLAKNFADIQKYFGFLNYEIEVKDPGEDVHLGHVSGNVTFDNVTYSYKGGTKNAVLNFNLSVKKGESIAFVGKSGSGKTTIAKLLLRFFDPEKGKITVDGIDIKKFKKTTLRNFFGVVPQEPVLFNNTISFNIGYGKPYASLKEVKLAAKMANIDKFIRRLPEKYNTNVGERGIKLSGGQKQRLAIARMILSDPDIIIFDEATSHLDSESEKLIQEAFWEVAKDKTTFIIAHRLSTVKKADRIIVMEKGRIVEEGTHDDLIKKDKGLYSHLWNLQLN